MKESDWKIFKEIKNKALEKYCSKVLQEFTEVINNENEHVHERYLHLYKLVKDRDKELSRIFDYHSRSKAHIQLTLIRNEGLADNELLSKLSEEFLEDTDPDMFR